MIKWVKPMLYGHRFIINSSERSLVRNCSSCGDNKMTTHNNNPQILNSTECLGIVKKALKLTDLEQIKLIDYEINRGASDLVGFMGEYYKLNICVEDKSRDNDPKQLQFFIKTVPISNEFHKAECERTGYFPKETNIYEHILPNVQKYVSSRLFPECYYTRQDIIVLEDLSVIGFRHLTRNESYTEQHCQMMLGHLAKLHASSIAWELNEKLNIGEKFKDVLLELQLTMKNTWYATGAKSIVFLATKHPDFQYASAQRFIEEKLLNILIDAEELTNPSKDFHNVICHRDSWDRNIFYKFNSAMEPIDCRIVDFQLTRYSPPAMDVLYFLYVTLSGEKRKLLEQQYLDCYYKALQSAFRALSLDENTISKAEFSRDCRRARLAVIILWAICEPLMKMPEGLANKMRAEDPERFDYYMNSERSEFFERIMALDPHYKEIIMAPIKELLKCLFENQKTHTYM